MDGSSEPVIFPAEPIPPSGIRSINGALLEFSIQEGRGLILGDDGCRYFFVGSEWKLSTQPQPGARLNFQTQGQNATAIYAQPGAKGPGLKFAWPGVASPGEYYRSSDQKVLGGVCAGFAHRWKIDRILVRVLSAVVLIVPIVGWALLAAYIAGWAILPAIPTKDA